MNFAVDDRLDLDLSHVCCDRNCSSHRTSFPGTAKLPGKFVGNQERAITDAQRAGVRIVIVSMACNIEKDEPAFAITHDQLIGFVRLPFFQEELVEGSV